MTGGTPEIAAIIARENSFHFPMTIPIVPSKTPATTFAGSNTSRFLDSPYLELTLHPQSQSRNAELK